MKTLTQTIIDLLKYEIVQFDTSSTYDIVEIGHFKKDLIFEKSTKILIYDVCEGDSHEELHLIASFILDDKDCEIHIYEHTIFKIIN